MQPVLLAITGAPWESEFVAELGASGLRGERPGLAVVRRCVDVADLLATASSGVARAALVWPRLHRLDGEVIGDLVDAGVAVVGLVGPGDDQAAAGFRAAGMTAVVPAGARLDRLVTTVATAIAGLSSSARVLGGPVESTVVSVGDVGAAARPDRFDGDRPVGGEAVDRADGAHASGRMGRLVAVWGPTGAPGRTSVAVTIAGELARLGVATVLADADVYGGTVAEVLGIVDEAPGLAAAVRLANTGRLQPEAVTAVARRVAPNLRVLTGLARADRWPELRPRPLAQVWDACRALAAVTVVDCGFCLEVDEEISFDVSAPRRNGATLATLVAADTICAVVGADPVGVVRFARAADELRAAVPGASIQVVVNRLRKGPAGRAPEQQIGQVIETHTGLRTVAFIPYDRSAFDSALRGGQLLAEVAPASPARLALQALARSLAGLPDLPRPRRRRIGRRVGTRTPT